MKVVIHSISVVQEYSKNEGWNLMCSNIRNWQPENPKNFVISLIIDLGEKGKSKKQGSDEFYIWIATPIGLTMINSNQGIISDCPLLVVEEYDWNLIWNNIEKKVSKCEANSWNASAERLSHYFNWEYDNYSY